MYIPPLFLEINEYVIESCLLVLSRTYQRLPLYLVYFDLNLVLSLSLPAPLPPSLIIYRYLIQDEFLCCGSLLRLLGVLEQYIAVLIIC